MTNNKFIGLKYPIIHDNNYGYFSPTLTTLLQVLSNLNNILSTKKNLRIMNCDFGFDLSNYIFDENEYIVKQHITLDINNLLNRYFNKYNLSYKNLNIQINRSQDNNIELNISFQITIDNMNWYAYSINLSS